MKILELFSGTASFSNVAKERGHETRTLDIDTRFVPDICKDIMDFTMDDLNGFAPNVIWASPPCQAFSVASISKRWTGGYRGYVPKTTETAHAIALVVKTVEIIEQLHPDHYFIENPRGVLRKLDIIPFPRLTCCYCQYGDTRMKPTDIWTNLDSWLPKMCHNGNNDHQEARRGAKTGTQGLAGSIERSRVPRRLCEELLVLCELAEGKGEGVSDD